MIQNFFSAEGRIRRSAFIVRFLLISVPATVLSILMTNFNSEGVPVSVAILYLLVVGLLVLQMIKRLHDIDMNGWLWLLIFVPLVNLGLLGMLLSKAGTQGHNQYGPDPKLRH